VLVAVCVTTIAASASAQTSVATAPERLTSVVVQPSIVHVRTQFSGHVRDRHGNDLDRDRRVTAGTSCSGFIVDPNGFITTSGQCLDLDLGAGQVIDTLAQRLWKRDRARSIGHLRGGPTVDLHNRVVGVSSIDHGHSQEPDLVTPASEVEQLLRDEGVRNDVGNTNRVYRNAVHAFFGRDRAAALTGFDPALKLQLNNKLVQRFRARALRQPVVNEGMPLLMKLGFGILSLGLLCPPAVA
jgi:hypothetical protein